MSFFGNSKVLLGKHEIGQVVQKTSGIKAKHAGWNPPGNLKAPGVRMRRQTEGANFLLLKKLSFFINKFAQKSVYEKSYTTHTFPRPFLGN
jgi:hypothetical protein